MRAHTDTSRHPLQRWLPSASPLVYGCMGLGGGWNDAPISEGDIAQAHAAVEAALAIGITLFDHADIYTHGKAEAVFGTLMRRDPALRRQLLIQSKCGIRFADATGPSRYDLSAAYIEAAVDRSLQRLGVDRLDLLLLHRPDPLMEPEEVAEAVQRLRQAGKLGLLGVSNMPAGQMAWLAQALDQPLAANQLQFSLGHLEPLEALTCFNEPQAQAHPVALGWDGTLAYCQAQGVQIQAWGALARGRFSRDEAQTRPEDRPTRELLQRLAARYDCSLEGLLLAWLMRHPARIQPVIGSADAHRIRACGDALRLRLSREDWYALYLAARGTALP